MQDKTLYCGMRSKWYHWKNELENKGMFGFPTSKSERILFKNREKGFMNALKVAFDKVSAIYIA